jgi:choline dehydrogenase-like flavoprotein
MSDQHAEPMDKAAPPYDFLIVGSGAGGAAAAYRLAQTGRRVLVLERGLPLPRDGTTQDVTQVMRCGAFRSTEAFRFQAKPARHDEYANPGGKTKWYGATLMRLTDDEFDADESHQCLAWPCSAEEMAGYYEEAERLLGVHIFPIERDLRTLLERVQRQDPAWREEPQPLGLAAEIVKFEKDVRRFDGFALMSNLKADAESRLLDPIRHLDNVTIITSATVVDLLPAAGDTARINGVRCADGRTFFGREVLLGAGALRSCLLLARYTRSQGLADALPSSDLVGRYYKSHIGSLILAVSPKVYSDSLRKTVSLRHPDFPHSIVQSSAWIDGELIGARLPCWVPQPLVEALGKRAYAFLLMTEEGSHADNRVTEDATGATSLDYDYDRTRSAIDQHRRLRRAFSRSLLRAGYYPLRKRIARYSTSHACGTLVATADAKRSVVDSHGRVQGLKNLWVVDASVLPRIGRGNPALTVFAWSLRVADHLAALVAGAGITTSLPLS